MIKLIDLIGLAGVGLDKCKIHCAKGVKTSPLEAFFDGTFQQWQEDQNNENFKKCKRILSLIDLDDSQWLFAGVYDVLDVEACTKGSKPCFKYSTKEVDGLQHLTGKTKIYFKRPGRNSYLRDKKFFDQLMVISLSEQRMSIGEFPGFNGVMLSHVMLRALVYESNPTWKAALSNVAGVYLISDKTTGKQYVGSAYGGDGIWQRWSAYIKTGHGGNKELRDLLKNNGSDHVEFFQFSLLEVCDINAEDKYIVERETHWKKVLLSREFGLNRN